MSGGTIFRGAGSRDGCLGASVVVGTIALTDEIVGSIDEPDRDPSNPILNTKVKLNSLEVLAGAPVRSSVSAYLSCGVLMRGSERTEDRARPECSTRLVLGWPVLRKH